MKVQPGPGAFQVARLELERPHPGQRLAPLARQRPRAGVAGGEHQGVQDRFRASRFTTLRQTAGLIGIEGLDLVPQRHALDHAGDHRAFRRRHVVLAERAAKRGTREGIGHRGMARHACCLVIARGIRPVQPPLEPAIQIRSRRVRVPRSRRCMRRLSIGDGHSGRDAGHRYDEPCQGRLHDDPSFR